ncbi:MAG TPA: 50S ribosomal protein L11 methyltransferase, partial [Candidatus Methylomirabilis sp.]|nr:50S ribosomal protein L11 methyltransferase [Candidatus Methylomirabilis sp.]
MDGAPDAEKDYGEIFRAYEFYHILEVAPGVFTPGHDFLVPGQKVVLRAMDRVDFAGKRVLDVGCRDGLFSFEAERRGAAEVFGIDNDPSRAA